MSVQKGRILIVDDEQGIRDLLIIEFQKLGYKVFSAVNGEDAISKLQTEKVDIIISDMKMPKVDGLDLLKIVKDQSPETEVIIITGYATVENALETMRNGAYDFVQKPFNIDELAAVVEKAIEKKELKMLVALYESSNAVFSSLKLEELFPIMTSLISKVTDSHEASIFLLDNKEQIYLASSSISRYDSQKRNIETLISKIYGEKSRQKEVLFFDLAETPEWLEGILDMNTDMKSLLIYPITLNNKIMGYLVLTKIAGMSSFVRSDIRNVSVFVSQIAQSITNTKLYEKLEVKISELEQALHELEDTKKKMKDLVENPSGNSIADTAAYIYEKADYIVSSEDVPKSVISVAKEIKSKAHECLHKSK